MYMYMYYIVIQSSFFHVSNAFTVSYSSYIFRAAGGVCIVPVVLLIFAFPVAAAAFSNWWLSYWIAQGAGQVQNVKIILSIPYL